ncbi:MAG: hypothetical protein RR224_01110 [Clostridia bacterium]
MGFLLDSKMKDVLNNPKAKAVLEEYSSGSLDNPQMKLVGGLTLRKLFSFPQCDQNFVKNADTIDAKLKAIE